MTKYELNLVVHCENKGLSKSKGIVFMLSMGVSSCRAEFLLEGVLND